MRVLITGWAGFIGSNLTRMILQETDWTVIGMDSHTYAARPLWVHSFVQHDRKYAQRFIQEDRDIRDSMCGVLAVQQPDIVIHLAAESHVCRSIEGPDKFIGTNINGTFNLLESVRKACPKAVFHHVSTDEVFGVAQPGMKFSEQTPYDPRSPYSASKAASDHLVMAYHHTYGLNTRISNCSNNFGANQHEEKLIPKTILKILSGEQVTVYGSGEHIRDWIWVDDHCRGILSAIINGVPGGSYLFGGERELSNLDVVAEVEKAVNVVLTKNGLPARSAQIVNTDERPTDDQRYAIDCSYARKMLGWKPIPDLFQYRLTETVEWYMKHVALT